MSDLTRIERSLRDAFANAAVQTAGFVPKSNSGFGARFFNLNFAGRCDSPREAVQEGLLPEYGVPGRYRTKSRATYRDHNDAHLSVRYIVPCRACGPCLRQRARRWATSAELETLRAAERGDRTWFGTLTLSPQSHFEMLLRAERKAGHVLEGTAEEFAHRHAAVSRELTLAFKRIRKRIKPRKFRYLLVAEKHLSGLPHYHMLLHESGGPIRKSELNGFWPWGFSQWRLVDLGEHRKAARYAAKYLSKSAEARVRASQDYGGKGAGGLLPPLGPPQRIARQLASPAESVARVNTAPETRGARTPQVSEV